MKHAALVAAIFLAACATPAAVHSAASAPASPGSAESPTAASPTAASPTAASPTAASPPTAPVPASLPVCRHSAPARCDAPSPAYVRDVLPVLKKRCFGCHTGDGVAADEHDFSRIEALRRAGTEIVDEVSTCAMPPKSRLDDDEAALLLRWVACGSGAGS